MPAQRIILICFLVSGVLLYFWAGSTGFLGEAEKDFQSEFWKPQTELISTSNPIVGNFTSGKLMNADTNDSSAGVLDQLLREINPYNDWIVSMEDPAVVQVMQDPDSLGIEIIDLMPALGTARFRVTNPQVAYPTLIGFEEKDLLGINYPLRPPYPPRSVVIQEGAGFEGSSINWLGGSTERGRFGAGVKVAIIDSGIDASHPALNNVQIIQDDSFLKDSQGGVIPAYSHGTAIASVIAGQGGFIYGIAPAVDILSYRVTDQDGFSDSFSVASAIVKAVQDGADVINISLGGEEGSEVLHRAVSYALDQNVPVVAAVGNDGVGLVNYPAAYDGVIGVTSVGTSGRVANFSNYGKGVDLAAPGVGVLTAWESEDVANFSGTSISAAMVTGAIAMQLGKQSHLSAVEIEQLLKKFSNESEKLGADEVAGHGILSLGRLENQNNPGYTDAAIVGYYFDKLEDANSGTLSFDVMVQNQGNTFLSNLSLEVEYLGLRKTFNIGSLSAGEVRSEKLYLQGTDLGEELKLSARLNQNNYSDRNPKNNQRVSVFRF